MTILDRANAFIGHEQEVDEGLEVTMRRNAFIAGYKEGFAGACEVLHDFALLVYRMRKAQEDVIRNRKRKDIFAAIEDKFKLQAEVDTWLIENYEHFNEKENGTTRLQD